jgi:cell surface protein SprA
MAVSMSVKRLKSMGLLLVLMVSHVAGAQTDTASLKYSIAPAKAWQKNKSTGNVDLQNPINSEWKYNPKSNRYEEFTTIGGLSYPTGKSLSVSEYFKETTRSNRIDYYREKSQNASYNTGSAGKGSINDYIKTELTNPTISKIFGEGGVDFQLNGSAMIKLGGNVNVNRNPSFSKRQQRYFVPVFDQQLQISANGSVGQNVKLGINYDTEAAFEFDNQTNLGWKGKPDGILKDIQVGNVSLNLPTQLIKPANNLFGFSTTMQFGKTTVKSVFSQNKGQSTETVLQGGQQLNEFKITSDNYDQNRHFFLAQYFHETYNQSLQSLPIVASGVIINRVEVWVTNRSANIETPRDILVFHDLGESKPYRTSLGGNIDPLPDNVSNNLYGQVSGDALVRKNGTAVDRLFSMYPNFEQTVDFDILNNARQLTGTEYTLNAQLGYISLNQPLNNDEILAVAFEYTYNGKVYSVGEFSRDVPPGDQRMLYLKMLKGNTIRTKMPMWNLMMKNIYTLNTYSLSLDDFKLNVLYADDTSGADYNYLPIRDAVSAFANGNPLIRVLGLDKLNRQQEDKPDGIFDAIEGLTVQAQYARIIFPVTEPFGNYMRSQFEGRGDLADYYCYDALYDSTKWLAQQDVKHNKFFLSGSYKSPNGAELFLGTTNLQKGSVRVTANGRPLQEGMDYEVDYALGRVRIINDGLLRGGAEIRASADGQSFFNIQQKTLVGGRIEHKFNKHLLVGGTALHMYERPLTTKTNFNEEPLLNTIFGGDVAYSNKSRFITRMVDRLPFLETKEISSITAYAEFAKIIPHNHKSQGGQRGVSNLEDFENAELPNDFKQVSNWTVASVPQKQPSLFPETSDTNKLRWLNRHASLSFYSIDQLFYRDADMPDNIQKRVDDILSDPYMRQIDQREVFPQRQFPPGTPTLLTTLDLVYRPTQRGLYNFNSIPGQINAAGNLLQPEKSWAGIMRRVDQNDFEAANIDYIEIWMMDPLIKNPGLKGEFYLHLGSISEDILPDRRKSFENGRPTTPGDYQNTDTTDYAIVPSVPQINFAFNNNPATLKEQDAGLDGMDDNQEKEHFDQSYLQPLAANFGSTSAIYQKAAQDPSNDNFVHYLEDNYTNADADIIGRYSRFQGLKGNSNPDRFTGKYTGMPKSSSSAPNDEDVNRDFTLNQSEDYYQYQLKISAADLQIGKNYVADIVRKRVKLRNGKEEEINWYQFKIPVRQYQKAVGNISDFKSIRFMRMVMTGFTDSAILRLGYINMVRADWRRYTNSLKTPGAVVPQDPNDNTKFVVSTVNLEENGQRSPVAYVTPPGVVRVQNMASLGTVLENEQSLSLSTCNMLPKDARGAFKTSQFDIRNYKNMQLFVHAEAPSAPQMNDGDVSCFVRFGTDLTNNYYEYEIPLKITRGNITKATPGADKLIWPDENFIDLELDRLYQLKIDRQNASWPMSAPFVRPAEKGKITVMGLPDVGNIRVMMIGIKNNTEAPQCFEVWVNELRVKNIANKGGWAALGNIQTTLADFGTLNLAGSIRTIGFGDVDKKLNDRSLSTNMNYDLASNLELGKFFPKKAGISFPMYIGYSENFIRPKFNPLNPDIEMNTFLNGIVNKSQRESLRKAAEDYSSLYSLNFNNVRIAARPGKKAMPWSLSNFNATYSFQRNYRRNQQIEEYFAETTQGALGYQYSIPTKFIRPFMRVKPKWLNPVKEINFNLLPSNFSTQWQVNRFYSENQARNNNNFRQINPRLYDKNFTLNRVYNMSLPLFSSLTINYNATANARIQEPYGSLDSEGRKELVRKEFNTLGRMTRFTQSVNGNYTLPFGKFRMLDWINTSINYTGSYEWNQAPPVFSSLGNKISNARDINVQGQLNFQGLYQKIPWLRNLEKPKNKPKAKDKKADEEVRYESAIDKSKESTQKASPVKIAVGNLVSMFKNVGFSYSLKQTTDMPGFRYNPDYFGHNFKHVQPGLPFVFGWQEENIRYRLAANGALNQDIRQSNFYRSSTSETFTSNVTIEPIKSLRIQLDFSRNNMQGTQSIFRWDGAAWVDQGLTQMGNFNISSNFIKTHFVKDNVLGDNRVNAVFKQFQANRYTVAQRLMFNDSRVNVPGEDSITRFPIGYSKQQQDVLIGAFYTAYAGLDPGRTDVGSFPKIPLPGWNINYNGLTRIKAIGKHFTNINIRHAYNGRYSVGSFTQNLRYDKEQQVTAGQDFVPQKQISDVTISEGFYPFLGINIATKNNWTVSFDYKRSRVMKLFAAQFNVTEMRSNEMQFQAGYRVTGLTLPFRRNGRKVYLPNDFRFDMSVSVADNVTITRKIDQDYNRATSGTKQVRIGPAATYQINNKINLAMRYNKTIMSPRIANQFYTALTDFGLEIRYTLN